MNATSSMKPARTNQEELLSVGLKHCSKCISTKPTSMFANNKARYDGLSIWCKSCVNAYNKERNQKPKIKARAAELTLARYHKLTPEEKTEYNSPKRRKKWHLQGKYNITLDWYHEKLIEQGGGCAICRKAPPTNGFLSIDHDHACCPESGKSCGKCVRGLLCITCNVNLHWIENDSWRTAAESYLVNSK